MPDPEIWKHLARTIDESVQRLLTTLDLPASVVVLLASVESGLYASSSTWCDDGIEREGEANAAATLAMLLAAAQMVAPHAGIELVLPVNLARKGQG